MFFKILLLILLCISACEPAFKSVYLCRDSNNRQRMCTKQEKSLIDGMRGIISQIRNLEITNFTKSFMSTSNAFDSARVVFFGEKHTEIISQIETLGAVNALAQEGDYLLLEGSDRQKEYVYNCALFLIFQVYLNWQWESLGQRYSVGALKDKEGWIKRKGFYNMLKSTVESYDISDLNLSSLTCGFWDDKAALLDTFVHDVNGKNFLMRNESMVKALEKALEFAHTVFVITGYLHMPIGDYLHNKTLNSKNNARFPKDMKSYYEAIKKAKIRSSLILEDTAGTTEPIYNYLINNNINFIELMHGRLLYQ